MLFKYKIQTYRNGNEPSDSKHRPIISGPQSPTQSVISMISCFNHVKVPILVRDDMYSLHYITEKETLNRFDLTSL